MHGALVIQPERHEQAQIIFSFYLIYRSDDPGCDRAVQLKHNVVRIDALQNVTQISRVIAYRHGLIGILRLDRFSSLTTYFLTVCREENLIITQLDLDLMGLTAREN